MKMRRHSLLLIVTFISLISFLQGQGTDGVESSTEAKSAPVPEPEQPVITESVDPEPDEDEHEPFPDEDSEDEEDEEEEEEEEEEEDPVEATPEVQKVVEEAKVQAPIVEEPPQEEIPEVAEEEPVEPERQEESTPETSETVIEEPSSGEVKSCSAVKQSISKLATKENVKKAVAAGLGMWGASVGIGWAMHKVSGD